MVPPYTTPQASRSPLSLRNVLNAPHLRAGSASRVPPLPTPKQRLCATITATSAPSPGPTHVGVSTSTVPRPSPRLGTHSTPPGLLLHVPSPRLNARLPSKPWLPRASEQHGAFNNQGRGVMDTYDARHESAGSLGDVTIFYDLRKVHQRTQCKRPGWVPAGRVSIPGSATRL